MNRPLYLSVIVKSIREEAEDIRSFELVSLDGQPLPRFSAGSHIDVQLSGYTRQYSLCNNPDETHRYLIAVLKDPNSRGGSLAMHGLHEGDQIEISAPKNHFQLEPGASSSLLLAGGIGITPILCMAERLNMMGAPFSLHYCTRSAQRTAFRDRIEGSPISVSTKLHFDDGADEQKMQVSAMLESPQPGVHLYVCGPKGFMNAVLDTARLSGWPEEQLHYEFFAGGVAPSSSDGAFNVKLASTGQTIPVASDKTVVEALRESGIEVLTSCEQGVCGTCLTRVLEGIPEHRDSYLTADERVANNQFLPCCSRASSSLLVLDL